MSDIDEAALELIHQEIDGENTPEQSARLNALLESDPAARETLVELRGLGETLAAVTELAPPLELKRRVLDALPPSRTRARQESATGWPAWRFAAIFAAGLVLGVVSYHLATLADGGEIAANQLGGAMTPASMVRLDQGGVAGTVECRKTPSGYAVEFDLSAYENAEVVLDWSASGLVFEGLLQQEGELDTLVIEGRRATATLHGRHGYTALLNGDSTVAYGLDLEVSVSGLGIHRDTLALPAD